jgi:hypothetical protein
MFIKAVGAHPSRLANLYFTFLFLTRAVAKAQDLFLDLDYSLGDQREAEAVKELIQRLVSLPNLTKMTIPILPHEESSLSSASLSLDDSLRSAAECSAGFDESSLFQVSPFPPTLSSLHCPVLRSVRGSLRDPGVLLLGRRSPPERWGRSARRISPKVTPSPSPPCVMSLLCSPIPPLIRFRNISRIMDCVSCEKCRVWGKLEILGLGTAIKILLTPEKEMREAPLAHFLSRQEAVALITTLHQFAKSIHFAAGAMELEFGEKLEQMQATALQVAALPLLLLALAFLVLRSRRRSRSHSSEPTA